MLNWLTSKHHPIFSVIFSDERRLCQITLFNHSVIIKKSSSVHQNSTTRIHSDVTATPFAWTCYLIPSNIVQYREHLRDTAVHTCVSLCVCVLDRVVALFAGLRFLWFVLDEESTFSSPARSSYKRHDFHALFFFSWLHPPSLPTTLLMSTKLLFIDSFGFCLIPPSTVSLLSVCMFPLLLLFFLMFFLIKSSLLWCKKYWIHHRANTYSTTTLIYYN